MIDKELEKIRRERANRLIKELSMPQYILELNTVQQYNDTVMKYSNKIMIIDFWAEWCGPCKFFAPVFERLHQEYSSIYIFAKVNVDINKGLAAQFGITGIPTTLLIKNHQVIHSIVGASNYEKMKQVLERFK